MSFRFAIRPATAVETEDIFQLLVSEKLFDGTLEALSVEIAGGGSSTYWVAARNGILLAVLRAVALGPGFPRFIALDQIALAPSLLRGEVDFSALEVLNVLIVRALGDIPALAVVNESQIAVQPSALAIISKALLSTGFAPEITSASIPESASGSADSAAKIVQIRKALASQLGQHVLDAQVFLR